MDYSPQEMMVAAAAREIEDGEVVFVGAGLLLLVFAVAKRTHAPNAVGYWENGLSQEAAALAPLHTTSDPTTVQGASWATQTVYLMGLLAQGAVDVGLVGGAQVDRFGNGNTTYLGPYHQPTTRLPGSGAAADIASLARRLVVVIPHERNRFVEQVDYITAPGYGTGRQWREGAGLPRGGPSAIVTTLGILRFDENGESYLAHYHPFTSVEEVQAHTGWALRVAEDVAPTLEPTEEMLRVIRALALSPSPLSQNWGKGVL